MSDLISRKDVIEEYIVSFGLTIEDIERIPAIDAEPVKHGYWIVDEDGNIECSVCGNSGVGDNFCERCGAKMDEVGVGM